MVIEDIKLSRFFFLFKVRFAERTSIIFTLIEIERNADRMTHTGKRRIWLIEKRKRFLFCVFCCCLFASSIRKMTQNVTKSSWLLFLFCVRTEVSHRFYFFFFGKEIDIVRIFSFYWRHKPSGGILQAFFVNDRTQTASIINVGK